MRLSSRLSVVAAVATAGLVPTLTTSAAAALAPHTRPAASRASITSGTAPLWAAQFKGTVGDTAGYADAVSPDGSMVFVTGNSGSSTIRLHNVGVTLAYNSATGTVLWQTRYNPTFAHNAHFNDVAVSPDGSMVFVTGQLQVATSGSDINAITAAYNASTGAQVWANVDQTMRAGDSITVSPDGSTVFVAGGGQDPVVAYSATTGTVLWSQSSGVSEGVSAAASPNGSAVYVAGGSTVAAYNAATGAVLWSGPAGPTTTGGLTVSPDGSKVFITGTSYTPTNNGSYYATAAFDATSGATLWTANFQKPRSFGGASAVAVSLDGSKVFVTGSMYGRASTTIRWGTVAYDASTGTQLWVVRFPNLSDTIQGTANAVSPDGSKVFVTGLTPGKSGDDYGTAAYDASTGALLWIGSYTRPGFTGIGRSVAVSPDGSKVFTAGAIFKNGGLPTFMVTLAYNS